MRKINILFNENEWKAFLRRSSTSEESNINYEDMIQSVIPHGPLDFPSYRNEFNRQDIFDQLRQKCDKFNVRIQVPYFKSDEQNQQNQEGLFPFRKVYDPFRDGKYAQIYDKGYMRQYKGYLTEYVEPSKNFQFRYQQSNQGIRHHDHFYDNYYQHLFKRDMGEELFNRFGKRYVTQTSYQRPKVLNNNEIEPSQLTFRKDNKSDVFDFQQTQR